MAFDEMVDQQIRETAEELGSASWQIRVEALRAASRVVTCSSFFRSGDYAGDTLGLAKRFERYLETGE